MTTPNSPKEKTRIHGACTWQDGFTKFKRAIVAARRAFVREIRKTGPGKGILPCFDFASEGEAASPSIARTLKSYRTLYRRVFDFGESICVTMDSDGKQALHDLLPLLSGRVSVGVARCAESYRALDSSLWMIVETDVPAVIAAFKEFDMELDGLIRERAFIEGRRTE